MGIKNNKSLLYVMGFILLSSCAMLPPKPLPQDASIEFRWHDFPKTRYRKGGYAPSFLVNNEIYHELGFDNYNHLYKKFEGNLKGVVLRAHCETQYEAKAKSYFCKIYQKISGDRMTNTSDERNIDEPEWELVKCGLFTNDNVTSFGTTDVIEGDCEDLRNYQKQFHAKVSKDRSEATKAELWRLREELKPKKEAEKNGPHDEEGRIILKGPVSAGIYNNVHIISNSVGVIATGATAIHDSVIDAPVCVEASGIGLLMRNNQLNCDLCINFTGTTLVNNTLESNTCTGRGTNRPDVFGW